MSTDKPVYTKGFALRSWESSSPQRRRALEIKYKYLDELMRIPGVAGVGPRGNGILILLERDDPSHFEALFSSILGDCEYETFVVGTFIPASGRFDERIRPLEGATKASSGGLGAGPSMICGFAEGTLIPGVRKNFIVMPLHSMTTNVLEWRNDLRTLYQPNQPEEPADWNSSDKVGVLLRAEAVHASANGPATSEADVALVNMFNPELATPTVHDKGDIVAVRDAQDEDEVFFYDLNGERQIHRVSAATNPATVKNVTYTDCILTVAMKNPAGNLSEGGLPGSSGSPLLRRDADGLALVGMLIAQSETINEVNVHAKAIKIQDLMNVMFLTKQSAKRDRSFGRVPMLLSDGLVADRWIIDNWFIAGEPLNAGDPVTIGDDGSGNPRLYQGEWDSGDSERREFRSIGFVHTEDGKSVGEQVCDTGDMVPLVWKGIALTREKANEGLEVGQHVVVSTTKGRVQAWETHSHVDVNDRQPNAAVMAKVTRKADANDIIEVFADIQ